MCGPSGAGKSTIIKMLMTDFPDDFGFSVSHTTRKPRAGEVDGVHYHFSTHDDINAAVARGEFLECAQVHTNLYGTSRAAVEAVQSAGRICVLDIDLQGALWYRVLRGLPRVAVWGTAWDPSRVRTAPGAIVRQSSWLFPQPTSLHPRDLCCNS